MLDSGTIKKGQTIAYSLRLWIDSRAENEVMGQIFNTRLQLDAGQMATNKIKSSEVKYYNENSTTGAETVEEALDELYSIVKN